MRRTVLVLASNLMLMINMVKSAQRRLITVAAQCLVSQNLVAAAVHLFFCVRELDPSHKAINEADRRFAQSLLRPDNRTSLRNSWRLRIKWSSCGKTVEFSRGEKFWAPLLAYYQKSVHFRQSLETRIKGSLRHWLGVNFALRLAP